MTAPITTDAKINPRKLVPSVWVTSGLNSSLVLTEKTEKDQFCRQLFFLGDSLIL